MRTKTNLLAAGMFLVALINAFGQNLTDTLPEAAQESVTGTPGVPTKRAVVNFSELARQEALARANSTLGGTASLPSGITNGKDSGSAGSGGPTSDGPPPGPPPADLCPVTNAPSPATSFLAFKQEEHVAYPTAYVPDTQGAVGPGHLMVAVNGTLRIQDRSGAVISTVAATNFWSPLGAFPGNYSCGPQFNFPFIFDPRILYDPFGQRWILTSLADAVTNVASLLIGVSQSNDPTGTWNLYRVYFDSTQQQWQDFDCTGFNKDWIVVQGNMFSGYDLLTSSYRAVYFYVFDKTNLYAGGEGRYTLFKRPDITLDFIVMPAITYDASVSTLYFLAAANNTFNDNSVRILSVSGPVGAEVLVFGPTVTTTNRWDFSPVGGHNANVLPQLGTTNKIAPREATFRSSIIYRNNSLWGAHHIYLPAGGSPRRTSIQWWQISPRGTLLQRGLIDDPSGNYSYSHPSIGVNKFNDLLIGYSRFSSNQYASANFSFRAASDPPSTLRTDTVLKGGEAPYYAPDTSVCGQNVNGWGDYGATMADPVNDLDLWTIQEYAATPSGGRDHWGTWWGHIVPPTNLAIQQSAWPNPVLEGQNLTYTLAVNYTGATNVTGVTLTNLLSPSVTLLAVSSSRGSCTNVGSTISCDLGSFANGDSAILTLVVSPTATNNLTNTVRVLANECVNPITSTMVTLVKADTDWDGMPDDWEMANGLNQSDPSDAPIDSDGDGLINLKEYLVGTNPTNSASFFRITTVTRITTGASPGERISFSTVAGRFYRIERSDDLGSNAWVIVADEIPGTGGLVAVTDPKAGTEAQRFYRVGVLP